MDKMEKKKQTKRSKNPQNLTINRKKSKKNSCITSLSLGKTSSKERAKQTQNTPLNNNNKKKKKKLWIWTLRGEEKE